MFALFTCYLMTFLLIFLIYVKVDIIVIRTYFHLRSSFILNICMKRGILQSCYVPQIIQCLLDFYFNHGLCFNDLIVMESGIYSFYYATFMKQHLYIKCLKR